MSPILLYLTKLSVGLLFTSLFYQLVLRRLTFYTWNRVYLLVYSVLCFLVPLINISETIEASPAAQHMVAVTGIQHFPHLRQHPAQPAHPAAPEQFDTGFWLMTILVAGIIFMTLRLLFNFYSYWRILKKARLISEDDVRIYHVDREISPFSFGRAIFYNPGMHREEELKDIILHEYIHVRQRHTIDVIWSELLCVLNWYHPSAWSIRNAIRQNLEYIADDQVLRNAVDPREYQYLLLKVAGVPEFRVANQFNLSSLKQRIIMMNKRKTPRLFLISFLFALPLLAGLLLFFRHESGENGNGDPFQTFWKDGGPVMLEDSVYIGGLLLHEHTGKPVSNLPISISFDEKIVKVIQTDADGYYYDVLPAKESSLPRDSKKIFPLNAYSLSYEGPDFSPFEIMAVPVYDMNSRGRFSISFLKPKNSKKAFPDFYFNNRLDFLNAYHGSDVRKDLKSYLLNLLPPVLEEHRLKIDYLAANPFPKKVLTKFRNGYFDRKRQLVGYVGETKLYLDGKPATSDEINAAFANYPFIIDSSKERRDWQKNGLCSEIAYITFDQYKSPPPAALLPGNVEWKEVEHFDLAELKTTPYFLDGFRQTYGVGSNLMPIKKEIRKIALFKGKLARYYDSRCDQIWWVETRPESEVFERPQLAFID